MNDEKQEELASLYALDLMEGEERSTFERMLPGNSELERLVVELRESAASLARLAAVPPPPALRDRVMAGLDQPAEPVARTNGRPRPNAKLVLFRSFVPWAIAASLAVIAGWQAQRVATTTGELQLARTEAELTNVGRRSLQNQLEAERIVLQREVADMGEKVAATTKAAGDLSLKLADVTESTRRKDAELASLSSQLATADTELVELTRRMKEEGALANLKITALASLLNNSPQARAVAVWDPGRQEGVLTVEKLPALLPTQDYQLWVVDPQYPNPVDGGVFTVDPQSGEARMTFKAKQRVGAVNAFAVTLERKGGVPKAEGPFVLLGK